MPFLSHRLFGEGTNSQAARRTWALLASSSLAANCTHQLISANCGVRKLQNVLFECHLPSRQERCGSACAMGWGKAFLPAPGQRVQSGPGFCVQRIKGCSLCSQTCRVRGTNPLTPAGSVHGNHNSPLLFLLLLSCEY